MMAVWTLCLPTKSPTTGEHSQVTFALAWQDQPSGIYLDRQFDWPTGEAFWIDVPVRVLQVASVLAMLGALAVHLRTARR